MGRLGNAAHLAQSEGFRTLNKGLNTSWAGISAFGQLGTRFFGVGELVVDAVVRIILSWSWSVVYSEIGALALADS